MIRNCSISIMCNGELGRDDNEAKVNLLRKLLDLAALGYVIDPDYEIRRNGTTGKTHFELVVMCEETNAHKVTDVADVYLSSRCSF